MALTVVVVAVACEAANGQTGLSSGQAEHRPATAKYLRMRESDRQLGLRFKERLQELLGPRLLRVRAFGSRARDLCRVDSDFDLLVVVDSADYETRRSIAHLGADLMLELDEPVAVSPLVMDPPRIERLRP